MFVHSLILLYITFTHLLDALNGSYFFLFIFIWSKLINLAQPDIDNISDSKWIKDRSTYQGFIFT